MPIFCVKSVIIYTGQKNLHWRRQPRQRQLSGMYANTTLANQQTQPSFRNSGFLKAHGLFVNLGAHPFLFNVDHFQYIFIPLDCMIIPMMMSDDTIGQKLLDYHAMSAPPSSWDLTRSEIIFPSTQIILMLNDHKNSFFSDGRGQNKSYNIFSFSKSCAQNFTLRLRTLVCVTLRLNVSKSLTVT